MGFKFIRYSQCNGERHRLRFSKGSKKITLLNHLDEEVRAELVLFGMSGKACGCVTAAKGYKEHKLKKWRIAGRVYNQLDDQTPEEESGQQDENT